MTMTRPLFIVFLFFSALSIAQEENTGTAIDSKESTEAKPVDFGGSVVVKEKEESKDTLQLINHKEATLIDSLWLNSLYQSPLYDSFKQQNTIQCRIQSVIGAHYKIVFKEQARVVSQSNGKGTILLSHV